VSDSQIRNTRKLSEPWIIILFICYSSSTCNSWWISYFSKFCKSLFFLLFYSQFLFKFLLKTKINNILKCFRSFFIHINKNFSLNALVCNNLVFLRTRCFIWSILFRNFGLLKLLLQQIFFKIISFLLFLVLLLIVLLNLPFFIELISF